MESKSKSYSAQKTRLRCAPAGRRGFMPRTESNTAAVRFERNEPSLQ